MQPLWLGSDSLGLAHPMDTGTERADLLPRPRLARQRAAGTSCLSPTPVPDQWGGCHVLSGRHGTSRWRGSGPFKRQARGKRPRLPTGHRMATLLLQRPS